MIKSFRALAALSCLFACNGGSSDNGGSDGEDTDAPAAATGFARVDSTKLGADENCLVTLVCDEKTYHENTGVAFEVNAPAECTVEIGSRSLTEQFGFPVHQDADGAYWAAPIGGLATKVGQEVTLTAELFKLFVPGDYACVTLEWTYDGSAPDFKGDEDPTSEDEPQHIEVDHDGQVNPDGNPGMGVMTSNDYMKVEGDHFVLLEGDDSRGLYVTQSTIGVDYFEATIIWPEANVYELRCDLE